MTIEEKYQIAFKAIQEVHSDMSGDISDNIEQLRSLKDEIEIMIEALESDL
jgi:hypothetical protein